MRRALIAIYDVLECLDCGGLFDAETGDAQPVCPDCGNVAPLETGTRKLRYRKTKGATDAK